MIIGIGILGFVDDFTPSVDGFGKISCHDDIGTLRSCHPTDDDRQEHSVFWCNILHNRKLKRVFSSGILSSWSIRNFKHEFGTNVSNERTEECQKPLVFLRNLDKSGAKESVEPDNDQNDCNHLTAMPGISCLEFWMFSSFLGKSVNTKKNIYCYWLTFFWIWRHSSYLT